MKERSRRQKTANITMSEHRRERRNETHLIEIGCKFVCSLCLYMYDMHKNRYCRCPQNGKQVTSHCEAKRVGVETAFSFSFLRSVSRIVAHCSTERRTRKTMGVVVNRWDSLDRAPHRTVYVYGRIIYGCHTDTVRMLYGPYPYEISLYTLRYG